MHFMEVYLRARDYMGPSDDGSRFVVSGWFRHQIFRRIWIAIGGLAYTGLIFGGLSLLLEKLPKLLSAHDWYGGMMVLFFAIIAFSLGALALNGAAKVYFAARLVERQVLSSALPLTQSGDPPSDNLKTQSLTLDLTISDGPVFPGRGRREAPRQKHIR